MRVSGQPEEGSQATRGRAPGDRRTGAGLPEDGRRATGGEEGRGRPEETTISWAAAASGEAAAPSGWAAAAARPSSSVLTVRGERDTPNETLNRESYPVRSRKKKVAG
jgi:hypothetical protein